MNVFNGVRELMQGIKARRGYIGIVSTNSQENIDTFLENKNLKKYVDFIVCGSTINNKSFLMRQVTENLKYNNIKVYCVCGEPRDIEAAQEASIESIAIGWSDYSDASLLQESNTTYFAQTPQDILDLIKFN